jgi:hypothetical protein
MNRKFSKKTVILLVVLAAFVASSVVTAQVLSWQKTYGGADYDAGKSIIQTGDGGYVIVGFTSSFGAGENDVFLIKTDSAGNMLWNKTYGGVSRDSASSVVQSTDGGYVIAGSTESFGAGGSDFYLVKTDSEGNMLWNRTYGGSGDDFGKSVVQADDGGYVIAGTINWNVAGTTVDVYLVKTNSDGNLLWSKTYGGTSTTENIFSVVQSSDGGYAIAGTLDYNSPTPPDVYLLKVDVNGNFQWQRTYGGTKFDFGRSMVQANDGGYVITGESFGESFDVYLVKTDANGTLLWSKVYGGTGADYGFSVVQSSDGGYAIAGQTFSYGLSAVARADVYLVKTDSNGNLMWNKTFGGTENDQGWSVTNTGSGGFAIVGQTKSFGAGNYDVYLIKTEPEPVTAITDQGTKINLQISGNITATQLSNLTITSKQSTSTVVVSFTVTGQNGTTGFGNVTIPKSSVPNNLTPTIYIDNRQAQNQGYNQDTNNFYVWYTTSFSTHNVSIVFASTPNVTQSPMQFEISLPTNYAILLAVALILIIAVSFALILGRKNTFKRRVQA